MAFRGISTLVLIGITMAGIGGWWMLFDQGIVQEIEAKYWIANDYLDVMRIEWHGLPIILFVVGIILAIVGATSSRKEEIG